MGDRPLVRLPVRAWDGFSRQEEGEARCRVELIHGSTVETTMDPEAVLAALWPDA
jgi:hypothetical protein